MEGQCTLLRSKVGLALLAAIYVSGPRGALQQRAAQAWYPGFPDILYKRQRCDGAFFGRLFLIYMVLMPVRRYILTWEADRNVGAFNCRPNVNGLLICKAFLKTPK